MPGSATFVYGIRADRKPLKVNPEGEKKSEGGNRMVLGIGYRFTLD